MNLEHIEKRLNAHHRAFRIYFQPESTAPYIRQLTRLNDPEEQENILRRLEYSESFVKPYEIKKWIDNILKKPEPIEHIKQEKPQTPFEEFINKAVKAFQCKPYNYNYMKALPLASLMIKWPDSFKGEISESLMNCNISDQDIDNCRRVAQELIKVAGEHKKDVKGFIREPYR